MTTLTPVPSDLITGLRTGDEQALEHGFKKMYPSLLAEADSELHDLPAASRVVERAFLQMLSESAADPANANTSLDHAMHQAIAREQSRRAAIRRFDHNEGVAPHAQHAGEAAGPQAAWQHIVDLRHRATEPHVADSKEAQHLAAEHFSAALDHRTRKSIPLLIVGVLLLCGAGYGLLRIDFRPSETFINAQLSASTARSIATASGRIGNASLADGTEMRTAAGSVVKVVNKFGDPLRALSVHGAVSFTVAAAKTPLEIRAGSVALSATEGKLDVSVEDGRPTIVRVVNGAPRVTVGDSSWVAAPGEAFAVDKAIQPASADQLDEAFGWMDGRFVVNGTVREVVAGLRRWYDVDVGIADAAVAALPARSSGSLESLSSALTSLERSAGVTMIWQDRHMLLFRK